METKFKQKKKNHNVIRNVPKILIGINCHFSLKNMRINCLIFYVPKGYTIRFFYANIFNKFYAKKVFYAKCVFGVKNLGVKKLKNFGVKNCCPNVRFLAYKSVPFKMQKMWRYFPDPPPNIKLKKYPGKLIIIFNKKYLDQSA